MNAAMMTPAKIEGREYFIRILRSAAARAPVHAPVPGSGIPTKSIRPNEAYFITFTVFFFPFSSTHSAILEKAFVVFIQARIWRMKRRINGTGTMFPITLTVKLASHGSPNAAPIGIAPRNSMRGTMEQKKTYK